MQKRLLLLKLRLCSGIGIRGENLVYKWLIANPESKRLTVDDLIKIGRIKPRYQEQFKMQFNSHKLMDQIRYNVKRVRWISILDANYPENLREANLPPIILFYLGDWKLVHKRLLGVVGARKCTTYTYKALNQLLPGVVKHDICVVSGLAYGVDSQAHDVALRNGGRTIAVIGTGLDRFYPARNQSFQRYIASNHLVISEYPLGTGVQKFHFPERNRIIAGLIESILIVEAIKRSGSLITANLALHNNRNVLAIPGPITSDMSVGCNALISEGAQPVSSAKDILDQFFNLTI